MGIANKFYIERQGFTLIELIVVVSVIGILAAVVAISYRGITGNAAASVLKSDIKGAAGQLNLAKASDGVYPVNTNGLSKSDGTVYQYTVTGGDYCLSVTSPKAGTTAYHISSTTVGGAVEDGVCSGHTAPSTPIDNSGLVNVAWTQRTGAGTCCKSIVILEDGAKLAGVNGTSFFSSTNGGATWLSSTPFSNYAESIASSTGGTRMFVSTSSSGATPVYMSTNFGVSWTTSTSARQTTNIASSSDGSKVAVDNFGTMRVSTDSGATWSNRGNTVGDQAAVDMSDDGSVLLGSGGNYTQDNLWLSNDMGLNWTNLTGAPTSYFWSDGIAVSGNGSVFYAINRPVSSSTNGYIYKSNDNGATWTQTALPGTMHWVSVDTSTNGSVVVAAAQNGYVYTSTDSGSNWTTHSSIGSRNWSDVAISADGTKIVATASGGIVYTGVYGP